MKFFTSKQKEIQKRAETQSPLLKNKITSIFSIVALNLMFYTQSVFASSGDFSSINQGLNNLANTIRGFALPLTVIALIVGGILVIVGGQQGRQVGKFTLLGAAVGFLIVNYAEPIANMINSF